MLFPSHLLYLVHSSLAFFSTAVLSSFCQITTTTATSIEGFLIFAFEFLCELLSIIWFISLLHGFNWSFSSGFRGSGILWVSSIFTCTLFSTSSLLWVFLRCVLVSGTMNRIYRIREKETNTSGFNFLYPVQNYIFNENGAAAYLQKWTDHSSLLLIGDLY